MGNLNNQNGFDFFSVEKKTDYSKQSQEDKKCIEKRKFYIKLGKLSLIETKVALANEEMQL